MSKKKKEQPQYSDKEIAFIENAMGLQLEGNFLTIVNQKGKEVAIAWVTDMDLTREHIETTCSDDSDPVITQSYMTAKYTLHIKEFIP
jgi:gamma-glutamyl phosphate reductase